MSDKDRIQIIECPRDAMQGLDYFIDTGKKVNYINELLTCGFDVLDMGSFVSPKAIPQMRDTSDVLDRINYSSVSQTKLLSIVANRRGAEAAVCFDQISYLGYPFSISETFQQRNTNKSIQDSVVLLEDIFSIAQKHGKEVVLYLSMGFGNPYGDEWSEEIVYRWTKKLNETFGASIIALSDTIGCAEPESLRNLFSFLKESFPAIDFGAHLHVTRARSQEIITAAYGGGCRRFDVAIKGYGGCPMAKDDLTGNLATEELVYWMGANNVSHQLNLDAVTNSLNSVDEVFQSNNNTEQ